MKIGNLIIRRNYFNPKFYFSFLKDGFILHWKFFSIIYGKSIGKKYKHFQMYGGNISQLRKDKR